MASFTAIIAMDTARIYTLNARVQGDALYTLLVYVEEAGVAAMIATLPRFVHSFSDVPAEKTLNRLFAALAAVSFTLDVLWINGLSVVIPPAALSYASFAMLVAVIVYSVTAGNIYSRVWPPREMSDAETDRWHRIMSLVSVLTFSFIPLFVLVDFFPGILPSLSGRLPRAFRTYPFFFLLWNLVYSINTLPTYRRQAPRSSEPAFGRFELSPREREVAVLLLEGLSYREIAEKLYVSLATVKTHVNRIYDKTGAGNKMELSRMLHGPEQARPDPSRGT